MTQTHVPNILAVATVLIGSWALISIVDSQRSGGGGTYRRDKNTYAGT